MKRIVSALVLGTAVIYLVLAAPVYLGVLVLGLISLLAAREAANLVAPGAGSVGLPVLVVGSVLILTGAYGWGGTGLAAGLAAAVIIVIVRRLMTGEFADAIEEIALGTFVLVTPVWLLAHAVLFLREPAGRTALLFVLITVWVCDSAAYFVGSALGRRKLASKISPNKTIEGSAAGTLSSVAVALGFHYLSSLPWNLGFLVLSGIVLSLAGQLGDLAESLLKRDAGVKDSGNLIPGHGGILDRIDALLFALPTFYYLIALFAGGMG